MKNRVRWPLGEKAGIVIDPNRCYGEPIIDRYRIETLVLAQAVNAEGGIQAAADWWGVDAESVRQAYRFETEYTKRVRRLKLEKDL